jgi:hypothetical protein
MKILFALVLVIASCTKLDIENGIPACIRREIKQFNHDSDCNTASVKEYSFQTKIVYTFDPGLCGADMTTKVLDSECNVLGSLGGYAGNTEINNEEFSNAVFIRTVWKK